jgi:hypothetical protein
MGNPCGSLPGIDRTELLDRCLLRGLPVFTELHNSSRHRHVVMMGNTLTAIYQLVMLDVEWKRTS